MYRARDYLEDESFIGASTSAIRSTLEEKLSAVSDWIHTDGPDAAEDVLKARLKDLTDLVDPVLNRKDEASKRPDAIKELRDALGGINEVIPMVKENIEKAAAKSKSAEEASKASASPSSTGSPDALDDLDDDASSTKESSSSSAMPPIPTVAADAEIYSESDLKFLQETAEKSTKWLEEKEAAQKQLSETDDPALTVKDINEQKKKVDDAVMEMMTKKFRFINRQQAEQRKEQERVAKEKARARKEKLKREKAAKKGKDKKGEKKEEAEAEAESKAEEQKKKNAEGPSEEELREALKKAGLASEDGIKLENLGPKDDLKDKDGNPLLKLNLDKDASEEDILAAIDAIVGEGREKKAKAEEEAKKKKKKEGEGHDEL